MASNSSHFDNNDRPTLTAVSSADLVTPITLVADPTTHALLTSATGTSGVTVTDGVTTVTGATTIDFTSGATVTNPGGGQANVAITAAGSGTVTSVSVVSANGLAGTVATATTTPAITLSTTVTAPALAGNGTAIAAATTSGTGSTVLLQGSPTITTPALNGIPTGTGVSASATANTLTLRDASANESSNNFIDGFTTTATAAGTTTLTIASTGIQVFTGSTTQIVKLPTTTVVAGGQYTILNQSSGAVTVQSSGANTILVLAGGTSAIFTALVATPTSAANWEAQYLSISAANGKVLNLSNTLTLTGTDGSSVAFGTGGTVLYTTSTLPLTVGGTTIASGTTSRVLFDNAGVLGEYTVSGTGSVAMTASPALTGTPTAPTQTAGDNTTAIATDAFVTTAVANAIAGVNPAVAVNYATTAAANTSGLTYNNGASGIGATFTGATNTAVTIDGHTFVVGDVGIARLLVKNDTQAPSGAFNGVYLFTALQTVGTGAIFTRALDYDTPSDINNTGAIPVISGTVNATTSWLQTSNIVTVGTTPLTYTQFSYSPTTIIPPNLGGTGVANNSASTITLASAKTFTINNTLTLAGTDSTTMTFPSTSATVAGLGTTQTFTGPNTFNNIIDANNAITASGNAATVPVTFRVNTVTNNSAATLTVTLTTSGAANRQMVVVCILDSSAAAQTITWVNTENSTVTAPVTSNGSTTLPLTVGFQYNAATSKWRCIASA